MGPAICSSIQPSFCPFVCLAVHINPSNHPTTHPSIVFLSVCSLPAPHLSIHPSTQLPFHPTVCKLAHESNTRHPALLSIQLCHFHTIQCCHTRTSAGHCSPLSKLFTTSTRQQCKAYKQQTVNCKWYTQD